MYDPRSGTQHMHSAIAHAMNVGHYLKGSKEESNIPEAIQLYEAAIKDMSLGITEAQDVIASQLGMIEDSKRQIEIWQSKIQRLKDDTYVF